KYQQGQQIPVENQYKIQINNMKRFIRIVDVTENPKKRYIKDRKESGLINQKDLIMNRYGASTSTISMGYEGGIANNLFKFVKKQNVDNRYFYFLLKKSHFKIKSLSSQSAMPALNFNAMDTLKFSIPQYSEQQKIGSFFSKLDRQIELEEQKLAKLEEQKKGYMQKIFSQELRFRDENNRCYTVWKSKNLGELTNITTGALDANAMVPNGKYKFFTCARETYKIDTYAFDTEALLISGNGANVGYIHYYQGKFNAYQRTYVLYGFQDDITFLKYYLEKYLLRRIYSEKRDGNTPYITRGTLHDMEIMIPSFEEQEKIGNFFNKIDKLIESQVKRVGLLKERKKGFLQKMFV